MIRLIISTIKPTSILPILMKYGRIWSIMNYNHDENSDEMIDNINQILLSKVHCKHVFAVNMLCASNEKPIVCLYLVESIFYQ